MLSYAKTVLLLIAFLVSFNGISIAAAETAANNSDSAVIKALNQELGGSLTEQDIALIEEVEKQQRDSSSVSKMSILDDAKRMNFLICVSGRGALIAKGRMGACSTLQGKIYNLLGYGAGLSAGSQISVFGLVVVTSPGQTSISGDYGSATTVAQSGLGFLMHNAFSINNWKYQLNALLRFLIVFGGPEFAVAQSEQGYLILAGVGIGPMFDLGMEKFKITEGPEI